MKERIVITDTEQTFNIVAQFPTQVKPTDFEHTKEQVPENFSELKELCKGSKVCINITKGDIKGSQFECIEIAGLILCENKKIYIDTLTVGIVILAQNRTPQQMWQIIKSLIGEE